MMIIQPQKLWYKQKLLRWAKQLKLVYPSALISLWSITYIKDYAAACNQVQFFNLTQM